MLVYLCPLMQFVRSVCVCAFSPSVFPIRIISVLLPSAFYCVGAMLGQCWPTVHDTEPTLAQYRATVSCLAPH